MTLFIVYGPQRNETYRGTEVFGVHFGKDIQNGLRVVLRCRDLGLKRLVVKCAVSQMLVYPIGQSGQVLYITEQVLDHFSLFRQKTFYDKEAGGQLFVRKSRKDLYLELATGPRPSDKRSRTSYIPDMKESQREINEQYERGLHFIGNWHTHPENKPSPSGIDVDTMKQCFCTAKQELLVGLILIIVGKNDFPEGLHVSVHDGENWYGLKND